MQGAPHKCLHVFCFRTHPFPEDPALLFTHLSATQLTSREMKEVLTKESTTFFFFQLFLTLNLGANPLISSGTRVPRDVTCQGRRVTSSGEDPWKPTSNTAGRRLTLLTAKQQAPLKPAKPGSHFKLKFTPTKRQTDSLQAAGTPQITVRPFDFCEFALENTSYGLRANRVSVNNAPNPLKFAVMHQRKLWLGTDST